MATATRIAAITLWVFLVLIALCGAFLLATVVAWPSPASAATRHRHNHPMVEGLGYGHRPSRWCGWFMRQEVGSDPGPAFNLARNWAGWGSRAYGPHPGVIVVWPHHVGKIVGDCRGKVCLIRSGNDGHAVRTRDRSIAGAIALRE